MKNVRRLSFLPLLLLIALIVGGCQALAPQTAALQSVHEAYREEFGKMIVVDPARALQSTAPENTDFGLTLRRIRDYRARYGNQSPEEAHLTVLEGMIYLQLGRVGMARLIQNDVKAKTAALTSGTGEAVRDRLFAESFEFLVQGWGEIVEHNDGDDQLADGGRLRLAAEGIERILSKTNEIHFASAEADAGGIYLAATAGTFNVWAAQRARDRRDPQADQLRADSYRRTFLLLQRFLSPTERAAARDASLSSDASNSRLRYIYWYAWLGKELGWPADL